jgi:hypothetical protein
VRLHSQRTSQSCATQAVVVHLLEEAEVAGHRGAVAEAKAEVMAGAEARAGAEAEAEAPI